MDFTASPDGDDVESVKVSEPSRLLMLSSFDAGYFSISLSLCSQALLWEILCDPKSSSYSYLTHRLSIRILLPSTAFVFLWSISGAVLVSLSVLYAIRCLLRFGSVKAEFSHHVGVNYLFAPWISYLLLLQSSPFLNPHSTKYLVLWWIFCIPIIALDVKIYGQYFTKGRMFLWVVANPTSQLSVIGNLVAARAAAKMGWKESAMCIFSLGIAHYLVLFVTLYQRLIGSGSDKLPVYLRPVFFLFFAAPSMASLTWDTISGDFDVSSKMFFFLSLFIFASLIARPALFKSSMRRFSVSWWAYSFPLTILALASTEYAKQVDTGTANGLMLIFTVLSVIVFLVLMLYTALNTNTILPNHDPFFVQSAGVLSTAAA